MNLWEQMIQFFETLDKNGGWFLDFLSYFIASGLILVFIVYIIRLWKGEINWLGQKVETTPVENPSNEKKAIEEQYSLLQKEKEALEEEYHQLIGEMNLLKQIYEELDAKYADETYTMTQIMYTAEEISLAFAKWGQFEQDRADIYDNLLNYLVNTLKETRQKEPRVVIHVKHPTKEDSLIHFAHSSSHSHRVKEYEPPIIGSSAGKAWRSGKLYYVPDVEDPNYEYHRKERSNRFYRTLLCIPLQAGNDPSTKIGVLSITGKPVDAYDKTEIERATLFSYLLYPLVWWDLHRKGGETWAISNSSPSPSEES
jgi:hypothetical protein